MATIRLKNFAGELPLVHPTLLPASASQTASNVRLETGALRPLRGPTTIQAQKESGTVVSIYKYNSSWFEWNVDVNAVGSPIANDSYDRVYYTGDSYPKFTVNNIATTGLGPYPANAYRLGIPAPGTAMTVAINGAATDPTDLPESRFYVVTYVDAYGSEGPPNTPSAEVTWRTGQTVDLSSIPVAPTGNYNVSTKRIYRVNTGSTGSVYQFVAEIAVATTTYNDAVASGNLGEALSTITFDPPPDDTMKGIVTLPGEFMAAFYSNVVCFSEPGFPHAWPIEYQLTTESPIVSIGVFGNSLLVTTEKQPYYITGITPASMTMTKLEISQACVSKNSIVDLGDVIIYASPDGLMAVGTGGVKLVTKGIFNREEWQKLVPSSIQAFYWEDMYIGFYNTGTVTKGFAIKPSAPSDGVIFFDTYATGGYADLKTDLLYLVVGTNIVSWDTDTANLVSYTWKSKPFHSPSHTNFGAIQVLADSYPVTITLTVDGVSKYNGSVVDENPQRLPSGYLGRVHEITIAGTKDVYEVVVANTIEELKRV